MLKLPRRDDVDRFEELFAREMGQRHAVAFPYGRTGLLLLLEAMGIKGTEILCPAYTCVVVAHAIVLSGNSPVFVDSEPGGFNMDFEAAAAMITDKTAAIIPTSIFGYPVDLDKLQTIRALHPQVKIIQDCAHSFAAEWKGRPVQQNGDAAIFGLNISKVMTSIFGGMVTTDDDHLAMRLRTLRTQRLKPATMRKSMRRLLYLLATYPAFWSPLYGIVNRLERAGLLGRFVRYYDEQKIDMPTDYLEQMSGVEARVGIAQTLKYRHIVARRRDTAKVYDQRLRGLAGLRLPPLVDGATYSHYVVRVEEREALLAAALTRGVELGRQIDYSIPDMSAYRRSVDADSMACPVASYLAKSSVNLPLSVGPDMATRTLQVLRDSLGERR
jgi:perosamine synthetase